MRTASIGWARRCAALLLVLLTIAAWPAAALGQTLEAVRERGYLVCAATNPLAGFSQRSTDGLWSGFDVDICRAVAAAVLGDPEQVEFRALSGNSRFALLQTGAVDLIVRNASWTLRRDTQYGASYVATSFFDGQAFMAPQALGFVSAFELDNVSVCVLNSGDELRAVREFFFGTQARYRVVGYEDAEDLGTAYRAGLCDVVSGYGSVLQAIRRALPDPAQHRILPERISKAPLGPVVRDNDEQWFDIVRWTVFALINAEELGLTSLNLESMASTRTPAIRRFLGLADDLGAPLGLDPGWMSDVIAAVGNYGEIYDRNFGPQTGAAMLRGPNALWTQGGLLFAPPIR